MKCRKYDIKFYIDFKHTSMHRLRLIKKYKAINVLLKISFIQIKHDCVLFIVYVVCRSDRDYREVKLTIN